MDDDYRLKIEAAIGDALIEVIQADNDGVELHIILMAFPVTHPDGRNMDRLGTPTFLSSLPPDSMKTVLIEIGSNYMPFTSEPNITGVAGGPLDDD